MASLLLPCFFFFFFFSFLASYGHGVDDAPCSPPSPLRVMCPLKNGFKEFVEWSGTAQNPVFGGFSIEVFQRAMAHLPIKYSYSLSGNEKGNGNEMQTYSYDDMVDLLANKTYDAVVGDLTITMERMEKVDFTQPYLQSALVVVVPSLYSSNVSAWDFLQPFSWQLWVSILGTFFGTGLVIFLLEKDSSPDFQEGPLKRKIFNIFWFTSSTIFFSQRESIHTNLGRLVTFTWLLLVLIFTSSYTANLSSILTRARLSTNIQGFESLKEMTVPVGYQEGSFTYDYLQMLGIDNSRLKALSTESDFAEALRNGPEKGGVAAIVDELPYVNIFLASNCDFTAVGNSIAYFGGLGFAFQKNSCLTAEVSMSILSLAQNGTLQKLQNGWIGVEKCTPRNEVDHLKLSSFAGLFYVIMALYAICLLPKIGSCLRLAFLGGPVNVASTLLRKWNFLVLRKTINVQVSPHISQTSTESASTN